MNGAAATRPATRWWLGAALPALVVAALQAVWPWPFFSDDSFVSLRYAERLLHGEGLTWTDGERVEGYSNLLWVLACSGLGALGLDLVTAARALGAACTAGALCLLARALRPADLRGAVVAAMAPLLVATSSPVLAWTLGGLEGPMVLLWLAWGFGALATQQTAPANARRALLWAGVPFALACWTRPDSPLWVAGAGIGLWLTSLRAGLVAATGRMFAFAALPIGAVLLQLTFRLAYHGDLVPNTAHVKAEFDPGAGGAGVTYVANALWALPGVVWPALLGAVVLCLLRPTRALALVLVLPLLLWAGYLMAIGGDHFPGRRLLHGALAPLALLVAFAGRRLAGSSWPRTLLVAAPLLAAAAFGLHTSRSDPQNHELRAEVWEWRGRALGLALGLALAEQRPLLAVDAAGAVPFYSRLPVLDMLGLCDRTIATTPYRDWLQDVKARGDVPLPPGHLRGNGAYVMERAPDLMLFGPPSGSPLPVFVSALEFEDDPRFLDGYRGVLFDAGAHAVPPGSANVESIVAPLWVHVRGRLGVQVGDAQVEIPAHLFGSFRLPRPLLLRRLPPPADSPAAREIAAGLQATGAWYYGRDAVAVPAAADGLELELRRGAATFSWRVPRGSWRLSLDPAHAAVALSTDRDLSPADAGMLQLAGDQDVQFTLTVDPAATTPVRVRRLLLQRL
jgi:hypothetical protein